MRKALATAAAAIGVLGIGAAGAQSASASARPAYTPNCTMTVTKPSYVYTTPSLTGHVYAGKHTGALVSSPEVCEAFDPHGFHSVNLANGGIGFMYADGLASPRPEAGGRVRSVWRITADTPLLTAPSSVHGHVLRTKHVNDIVISPRPSNLSVLPYVEVLTGADRYGWIRSTDLTVTD